MKILLFVYSALLLSVPVLAQNETEPTRIDKFIKKQKGKYGIWIRETKEFAVLPEYDKISGVSFTSTPEEEINLRYYKCSKAETFDLLLFREVKGTSEFRILLKGIHEFDLPFNRKIGDKYVLCTAWEKNGVGM